MIAVATASPMTAPTSAPSADPVGSPVLRPRLLRSVPCDPPYEDELAPLEEVGAQVVPLALVLPRRGFGSPKVDLPALARHVADDPSAPPQDEARRVEAELQRIFGRRRTPRQELPAPGPRAAAAVRLLLEVVTGERAPRQVSGWVSPRVLAGLERRTAGQRRSLGRRPVLRSLRVTEPADGVAEVSAVVGFADRVRAVALRLDGLDGRWTVTALHVG